MLVFQTIMLEVFRKNTKVIIWLTIAAMALWTASSIVMGQGKQQSYAGEVFGKKVRYKEFNSAEKMVSLFSPDSLQIGGNALDKTWFYLALKREAENKKITVSDAEVIAFIDKTFSLNHAAGLSGYENWVRSVLKDTPRNFEEIVRDYLKIEKLLQQNLTPVSTSPLALRQGDNNPWFEDLMKRAAVVRY